MAERIKQEFPEKKEEPGNPFYPYHLLKEVSAAFLMIAFALALVAFFPPELGSKADPLNTPAHIKPEWYFLSIYQFLKIVPRTVGILLQIVGVLILVLIPFIDRGRERNPLRRPVFTAVSAIILLVMIALALWGHFS